MLGFGLPPDGLRGSTAIKGVRDIASGVLVLVVWAAAGHAALARPKVAAALLVAAGPVLALG